MYEGKSSNQLSLAKPITFVLKVFVPTPKGLLKNLQNKPSKNFL